MSTTRVYTQTDEDNSNKRILKVEEVGDFYRKRTKPLIRLQGKWLMKAGILPNNHIEVENPEPGVLLLKMIDKEVKIIGQLEFESF